MAKVTGPLFSLKASGDLAQAIQYVCGNYTRKKPKTTDPETPQQTQQRSKFQDATSIWRKDLTSITKYKWSAFKIHIWKSRVCAGTVSKMTGYNLWISFFLDFGEHGWPQYPDPPYD